MKFNIFFISLIFITFTFCFTACHTAHQDKVAISKPAAESMTEFSTISTEEPVEDETSLTTEAFTTGDDKFSCYDVVDNMLSELCNSKEFINATYDKKAQLALSILEELESEGFIMQNSICKEISGDIIRFRYINGTLGGFFLKDFEPEIN